MPRDLTRPCVKCGVVDRYASNGDCRPCAKDRCKNYYQTNKGAVLARSKQYHKESARTERSRDKRYGLASGEYDRLCAEQGGVCAICFAACSSGRRLAVDHDHISGAVRGLLCMGCNTGVGNLKDNPAVLRAAADYLEERSGRTHERAAA